MTARSVVYVELGSGGASNETDREKWLGQFPTRRHPPAGMAELFVSKFIAERPDEFDRLKSLMRQEADLVSVMSELFRFLDTNGFDQQYDSLDVFHALREAARS